MPKNVTDYRERVKQAYLDKYKNKEIIDCAFTINIGVILPRPKSHYGTGKNSNIIKPKYLDVHHTQRPDVDNFVKGILDSLNGVAYLDDSQCFSVFCTKHWGEHGMVKVAIEKHHKQANKT